jgi:hypothetical protein
MALNSGRGAGEPPIIRKRQLLNSMPLPYKQHLTQVLQPQPKLYRVLGDLVTNKIRQLIEEGLRVVNVTGAPVFTAKK